MAAAVAATRKLRLLSLREHLGSVMQIFPQTDVEMWGHVRTSRFRGAWTSVNFYKEYLFGFETLVFATSQIFIHQELETLQRERKN